MVVALLCVVSAVALAQFGLFYWRAVMAVVASTPLSERVREAAGIGETVRGEDFATVINLHEICPELKPDGWGIQVVRGYYGLLSAFSRFCGPDLTEWTAHEMATCSRYVAARLDQRIQQNRSFLTQVRA